MPSKISLLKDLMQDNLRSRQGFFIVRARLRWNLEIVKELEVTAVIKQLMEIPLAYPFAWAPVNQKRPVRSKRGGLAQLQRNQDHEESAVQLSVLGSQFYSSG